MLVRLLTLMLVRLLTLMIVRMLILCVSEKLMSLLTRMLTRMLMLEGLLVHFRSSSTSPRFFMALGAACSTTA